ncbi:MAG: RHS repeat-associated core domain-containing protein [Clostridia bacterium]
MRRALNPEGLTPSGYNASPNGTGIYQTGCDLEISGFIDADGTVIANYYYDDWGKLAETTGDTAIANLNPIRYRSYYFDTETGWYYLNTRYYSPDLCRFINTDGYVQTGQDILDKNMFAYCGNNPINRFDENGLFWEEIGDWFKNAWNSVKTWASNTFGAESSTYVTTKNTTIVHLPDPLPITAKTGIKITQKVSEHGNSSKPVSVRAERDAVHPIKSSSAGIKINISNFILDISLGLDNIGISGSLVNENTTNSFGLKVNLSELKVGFEGSSAVKWDNTTETTYTNASINGWTIAAAYVLVTTGQQMPSPAYAY